MVYRGLNNGDMAILTKYLAIKSSFKRKLSGLIFNVRNLYYLWGLNISDLVQWICFHFGLVPHLKILNARHILIWF